MKRIEITEENGVKLGRLTLSKGDIMSFDDDVAQTIIDSGWGKCVVTGEQGERKPGSVKLTVDSVVQKIASL